MLFLRFFSGQQSVLLYTSLFRGLVGMRVGVQKVLEHELALLRKAKLLVLMSSPPKHIFHLTKPQKQRI